MFVNGQKNGLIQIYKTNNMQKVLATFYLNNDYNYECKFVQDIKTGETFVITPYSKYDVQEFEKQHNVNLNDLLN